MARNVKVGLTQVSNPINDETVPVAEIQAAALENALDLAVVVGGSKVDDIDDEGASPGRVFELEQAGFQGARDEPRAPAQADFDEALFDEVRGRSNACIM